MNSEVIIPASADTTITTARPDSFVNKLAWFFSFENRYLAPMLITLILLIGQLTFGFLESWWRTILAICTSILMEMVLGRLITGQWPHLASAYISGISIGILIRSPFFWPYALCAAISITSKYVIRWRGRHLWNPSNFAICVLLLLAPEFVSTLSVQWGNTVWPMLVVWALGSLIIYRLQRFHITLTYVLSFILLALLRSAITGHGFLAEVSPITGPMYQLFIFFMITDPKTTVKTRWGQCLVAFLVAVMEMILRLTENIHAPYYALTIVGPLANIVEIWWTSRKQVTGAQASRLPRECV
ncbi:MAG: RnfABCDGE type electron transport complex subunit D [Blastocatellia bacterium]|nr:RnfABCDGE type electron transport complex subunit D [Blastocatellia bacterium]